MTDATHTLDAGKAEAAAGTAALAGGTATGERSEEHTSELQSHAY